MAPKANAVVSATTPNGALVEKDGTATRSFLKWLQNIGITVNQNFNVAGNITGAAASGSTIASTDNITDGSGSPLAGGKEAFLALVPGATGDVLTYDGTSYGPQPLPAAPTVVDQIIAGTGITITPPGGQGVVTINAIPVAAGYSLGGALTTANVVLGPGAGTGATLTSVVGLDGIHQIGITIGTAPVANGIVFTTTFTATRGHTTFPIIQCVNVVVGNPLVNLTTAVGGSATGYQAFNTSVVAGVAYVWNISAP